MSFESSDEELPSLSERILQVKRRKESNDAFDKENADFKLFKAPEKILAISSVQNKMLINDSSDSDGEFSKICERLSQICTPKPKIKEKCDKLSDSEDESEFLEFSKRILSTPHTPVVVKQNNMPVKENPESKPLKSPRKILGTSLEQNKIFENHSSDSDDEFSNICERAASQIYTPNLKIKDTLSDSDDEFEFLEFSKRIQSTPHIPCVMKSKNIIENDNQSLTLKENFIKNSTSTSRKKYNTKISNLSPEVPEKKKLFSDSNSVPKIIELSSESKTQLKTVKSFKTTAEKEYDILFPPETRTKELTIETRNKVSEKLYEFFNKHIFASKLPQDFLLIWDNSLLKTAGKTHCQIKDGVYSCYISLSVKLITCFDRLQDVLLHELCHAAVWIISKCKNDIHGPLWQTWASRCNVIMPSIERPTRCHNYEIERKVTYLCENCKFEIKRLKRSKKFENVKCPKCRMSTLVLHLL